MTIRKTLISATTGQTFQVDTLPEDALQEMRRLIGRIKIATGEYDGSSNKRIRFLSLAARIAHISGGSTDGIQAYASQAFPSNNGVFSLDDLYRRARARLLGSNDVESSYGVLLKTFRDCGSKHLMQDEALKLEYTPAGNSAYQPRLATLIDMLCDQGLGIEKLMITTGPYKLPRELRDSYIIISDTSGPLQVAICDDTTMPTYVSKNPSGKDFWKASGVKVVQSYDFDYYVEKLRLAIGLKPESEPNLHLLANQTIIDPSDIGTGPAKGPGVNRVHTKARDFAGRPAAVADDSISHLFANWAQTSRESAMTDDEPETEPATTSTRPQGMTPG